MPQPTYSDAQIQELLDNVDVYRQSFQPADPPTDIDRLRAVIWERDRYLAPTSGTALWGRYLDREREGIGDGFYREAEWWLVAYDALTWLDEYRNDMTDEEIQEFYDDMGSGIEWPRIIEEMLERE